MSGRTYLTGHSPAIQGLIKALGIALEGVTEVALIANANELVQVRVTYLPSESEVEEVTSWILREGLKAEQLADDDAGAS